MNFLSTVLVATTVALGAAVPAFAADGGDWTTVSDRMTASAILIRDPILSRLVGLPDRPPTAQPAAPAPTN
jgi:hypothetical protein